MSDIIRGLEWCIDNKMDIINMSFGMHRHSPALYEAIMRAHRSGIIIVASSGNDGKQASVDYPARFSANRIGRRFQSKACGRCIRRSQSRY